MHPRHDSARLNESFGLEKGRDVTFIDSYHGLKSRAGDTTVANCASCHGAHRILPSSDPRSSISPDSLQVTCGGCHTGISAKAAQVPIHAIVPEGKWPGLFRVIYTLLIVGVIGGMVGYVLLDYRRQYRESLRRPQIARMSKNAIIQHMLLFVSFTVLVITGLALRYSAHWPFQWLFGWDGGFGIRGTIHRCAAALFLFSVVWHVIYLFSREGRGFLGGMVPGRRDLVEVAQAIRYNLGLSREKPRFGRFSFVERAEYWALVWGTVVMAATGFALWFRNFVVLRFDATASFLEVMRVIHLYEAWLATLAILVWHFYGVIFKPGVYPGNPAWLTGSMPAEMHEEEHPGEHEEHGHRGGRDRHEDPAPAERKRREVRADAPV
ncbi:MAG: hypothetical protein R3E12_07885 [Candidatus Eisenbacteria bacterium]